MSVFLKLGLGLGPCRREPRARPPQKWRRRREGSAPGRCSAQASKPGIDGGYQTPIHAPPSPPEPATAAAACPAAQKVESPPFEKLVRPSGPGCSESRGDLASAASRARFPRVGEIWRRRQKGTSVCGTCTFFVFRAPSWDLGNATLSSKTECTAVYSRHTRLLWTLSDGGMPMIAIWLQRRLGAGRQAWWGWRMANDIRCSGVSSAAQPLSTVLSRRAACSQGCCSGVAAQAAEQQGVLLGGWSSAARG